MSTQDKAQIVSRTQLVATSLNTMIISDVATHAKQIADAGYNVGGVNEITDADLTDPIIGITHFTANDWNLAFQSMDALVRIYEDGEDVGILPDATLLSLARLGWQLSLNKVKQA